MNFERSTPGGQWKAGGLWEAYQRATESARIAAELAELATMRNEQAARTRRVFASDEDRAAQAELLAHFWPKDAEPKRPTGVFWPKDAEPKRPTGVMPGGHGSGTTVGTVLGTVKNRTGWTIDIESSSSRGHFYRVEEREVIDRPGEYYLFCPCPSWPTSPDRARRPSPSRTGRRSTAPPR